jgi:hypothetical protein
VGIILKLKEQRPDPDDQDRRNDALALCLKRISQFDHYLYEVSEAKLISCMARLNVFEGSGRLCAG